jgi:hypothetical protein
MEAGIALTIYDLKEYLTGIFTANQQEITRNDSPFVAAKRAKAYELFSIVGFPHAAMEKWRGTDLSRALNHEYIALPEPPSAELDIDKIFKCDVPHFETLLVSQLNGWYADRKNLIKVYPNGMIIGSLAAAFSKYPELISAHYGQYADDAAEGLTALRRLCRRPGRAIRAALHFAWANLRTRRTP